MKIQKGRILIEDMNLKPGEIFQVGEGSKAFKMRYLGVIKAKGKRWDMVRPVKD
jgi:hypothetical protein